MKRISILTLILLFSLFLVVPATPAGAQWLQDWLYRVPVEIANPCGSEVLDQEVLIGLDATFDFAKPDADGSDLRVTADDGTTELDHWLETWDPGAEQASLWVRVPVLPAAGLTVYVYYDKDGVATTADADSVFFAYDGFETTPETGNPGEWARYAGNPILNAAGEFRMYYHGFSGGVHQIGLATSPDGLNWTKYAGNPIMIPGPAAWDGQSVRVPMVWKEGTDYHMIYTGNGSSGMQVGYATSADGIAWTKHASNPVFNDPTWATGETENWGVMKVGDEYLMWYSDFGMRQSSLAVSTDLVNWAPYQTAPVFASSGNSSDQRYSQYCPSSFKYGDYYYVLVPSYSSVANYSQYYLYRSLSPYFPEAERELVRIAHTVGEAGAWDSHDSDTPLVLTLDIERTQFYNDELWCYYAGEGGGDYWKVGLHIEPDIAAALAVVPPAPAPDISWAVSGDVSRVGDPVRSGAASMLHDDTSGSASTQLAGSFAARPTGVVSAWLRRDNTTVGDFDLYLYGNGGSTLSVVAGLGRNGDFHYWNGAFQPTGATWATSTWYRVELAFDAGAGTYDFVVEDAALTELVRVEDVAFGNPAASLDRVMGYTSSGFVGLGVLDDVIVREWCGAEPGATVGAEELNPLSTVPGAGPDTAPAVLHQNVPNPLNPFTRIDYEVREPCRVILTIYDLQGRLVTTLIDRHELPGMRSVTWDGRDAAGRTAATGAYLYRLAAGPHSETRRMMLVK